MPSSPRYLLHRHNGNQFSLVETNGYSYSYDIVSYCWGGKVPKYDYNYVLTKSDIDGLDSDGLDSEKDRIEGLNWDITVRREKVNDIKKLMCFKDIDYLWADCVCINKNDKQQESEEFAKMFQYYKVRLMSYIFLDFIPRDFPVRCDSNN
jgi:hypothetical protein